MSCESLFVRSSISLPVVRTVRTTGSETDVRTVGSGLKHFRKSRFGGSLATVPFLCILRLLGFCGGISWQLPSLRCRGGPRRFVLAALSGSEQRPRRPKSLPRSPQDGPRRPQEGINKIQKGPMTAQESTQRVPKGSQESSKRARGCHRRSPRGPQEAPKTAQARQGGARGSRDGPGGPQDSPKDSKRTRRKALFIDFRTAFLLHFSMSY